MIKYLVILNLLSLASAHATLAGGRLNAFSGGENAFAGVVNPANAVWLQDRLDLGLFWVHQRSTFTNHDHNPLFPPNKLDLTYRTKNLLTADAAIQKNFKYTSFEASLTLATYTLPTYTRLSTKVPIPLSGNTPIFNLDRTNAVSGIFSLKFHPAVSMGFSVDYFYLTHCRNGYQHANNAARSVSPGNVTNNGNDHSDGVGCSIGLRWKITDKLDFGTAWSKKTYCGQFKKYQGYEPKRAKNYTPHTLGAGFSYHFTPKVACRLEGLWMNYGCLPRANNAILPNGKLNRHKRGSENSPGPGLQDAFYLNMGLGGQIHEFLAIGAGYSHRFRLPRNSPFIIAHSYLLQTVFDTLSFGANFNYDKHNLFLGFTYGFNNRESGLMPPELEGGRFTGTKQNISVSLSWGYRY